MFKVETAKKIHVVYKNPIDKEIQSNACGSCSNFDNYSGFGEKKPSGFDLTGGKGFGGLMEEASKQNMAKEAGVDYSKVASKDKKFWDNAVKAYNKVKGTQGFDVAKNGWKQFLDKQKGLGNTPPPFVEDEIPTNDKKKITTLGWVGIGVGALALIGLVVYVVKKNK